MKRLNYVLLFRLAVVQAGVIWLVGLGLGWVLSVKGWGSRNLALLGMLVLEWKSVRSGLPAQPKGGIGS